MSAPWDLDRELYDPSATGLESSSLEGALTEDDEERLTASGIDEEEEAHWESGDERLVRPVCPLDCPLRKPYEQFPDLPLPPPPAFLLLTREEACAKLYGGIKEWQTRLLVLEPGPFGSELVVSLPTVDVVNLSGAVLHDQQERVEYTALSYTWGDQIFPRAITINGVTLPITENLFAFLQRYREGYRPGPLWIDAICINQFNLIEKAIQVSNMLAICEKAKAVIVWLGEEGLHTKLAAKYLHWAQGDDPVSGMYAAEEKWHSRECCDLFSNVLEGIEDLCNRAWVRRVWVKQEVWASREVTVHCGTSILTWNEYFYGPETRLGGESDGIEYVGFADYTVQQHRPQLPVEQFTCLQYLRRRIDPKHSWEDDDLPNNQEPHRIFGLLNESHDCLMTEPRDRIYALMGIAGILKSDGNSQYNPDALRMSVDYKQPLEHIFQELAMSLMHNYGAYAILTAIGEFGKSKGLDLPSWTPDFRLPIHFHLMREYHLRSALPGQSFYIKDERLLRNFRQSNSTMDWPVLRLEGFRVAEVTHDFELTPYQREALEPETHEVLVRPMDRRLFACRTLAPNQVLENLSLKLMSANVLNWIDEKFQYAPRGHEHAFPFQATKRYLEFFDALAVPDGTKEGDILAFVATVPLPVVLRAVPEITERFVFVGCAWLLASTHGLNKGQEDVIREARIAFQNVYDLEHRKETFLVP